MRKVGKKDSRGRDRVQTVNEDPSETLQSDAHLADINKIMAQWEKTGGLGNILDNAEMMFLDVTEFEDLADALNQAKSAEVEFLKLPSKVRELFDHDVATWLDTAHDPEKREAMRERAVKAGFIKEPVREEVISREEEIPDPVGAGPTGQEEQTAQGAE